MRFYRMFLDAALIGLLVPVGTALAGAGNELVRLEALKERRECSLKHICADTGQPCTVLLHGNFQGNPALYGLCDEPGVFQNIFQCPGGKDKCVVEYLTEPISGTLTVIADDQFDDRDFAVCAGQTIFLRVERVEDNPPLLFKDAALIQTKFLGIGTSLEQRLTSSPPGRESEKFLLRRAPKHFANRLIDHFGFDEKKLAGAVPVITSVSVEEPPISKDHSNFRDSLASLVRFKVEIRFATPSDLLFDPRPPDIIGFDPEPDERRCESGVPPIPGDLDEDNDVDQDDVNRLLSDRNKSISQSSCGAYCDLDGDGKITALDARKLTLFCTRRGCATR